MASPREMTRIVLSMTAACAAGATVLGAIYMGTEGHARAQALRDERRDVTALLALDPADPVLEVRQLLDPARQEVVYRVRPMGAEAGTRQIVFTLGGTLARQSDAPASPEAERRLQPLGRMFVATHAGMPAGFVVEGSTQGYKNSIRFLVALDSTFTISGVRVVEQEEDPGLGAEIARPWFAGQFVGRDPSRAGALDVTRDPLPEDWRSALAGLERMPTADWRRQHEALVERESARPIHAVTGATISSRAYTEGVRETVDHFRRRWTLIRPWLGART